MILQAGSRRTLEEGSDLDTKALLEGLKLSGNEVMGQKKSGTVFRKGDLEGSERENDLVTGIIP